MIFRGTVFFRARDQGWTENIYIDRTTHALGMGHLQAYRDARLALLATDCNVVALRVANVDNARDSLTETYPLTGGGAQKGLAGTEEDPAPHNLAQDALNVELFAAPDKKNRIFLRGIPDFVIVGGLFQPDVDFLADLTGGGSSLQTLLQTTGYKVRTKGPDGPVYSNILSIAVKGVTTRKTGRPFGLPVGRRKTHASA